MFKNGVGRNTIMIVTLSNGDVIKTSEIAFVSRMEEKYISNFKRKFYYNIIVNNIEIERNLIIRVDKADISEQFSRGSLIATATPEYTVNGAEKFDEKIQVRYKDMVFHRKLGENWNDADIINFTKLQCFKNFDQERLNLIEKLR